MSGDVLVKWDWEITAAEAAISYGGGDAGAMCICDLAAALRAERERVEELERLDKERLKWRESYLYEHENHVRLTMRNRENADLYNMTLAKLNAARKEET